MQGHLTVTMFTFIVDLEHPCLMKLGTFVNLLVALALANSPEAVFGEATAGAISDQDHLHEQEGLRKEEHRRIRLRAMNSNNK